jgi:hypothetical protein
MKAFRVAFGLALCAGCHFLDSSSQPACVLSATAPVDGASTVGVADPLSISWSAPVDPASLTGRVTLVENPGGDALPIAATLDADGRTVHLAPTASLRFWSSYTMVVGRGVVSRNGDVCPPVTATFFTLAPRVAPRPLRPAAAHGLVRAGAYLIAASAQYRGLQVYRVDAPDQIALVGDLLTDVEPIGLRASGDRAYAPAGFDGLLIFDISNPAGPRLIARAATPGSVTDVAPFAAGGRLYLALAEGPDGVRILDVTDPRQVVDLGALDPSAGAAGADARSVFVAGDLLAVGNTPAFSFSLISVADPQHPALLSSTYMGFDGDAVVLDRGVLYVAQGFYGIQSFDVSDPAHPAKLMHVDGPHGPCGFSCQDPFLSLVLDGNRLWVPALYSGAPSYTLDGLGGMQLANVVPVAGSAQALVPGGDHVFVGAEEGLVVFPSDATAGTPPTWFDPHGHGLVRSLSVPANAVLYAAASVRGLQTFALTNPLAPALVDVESTPATRVPVDIRAASVLAGPDSLYVGDGRVGLTAFDLAAPAHPVEGQSAPAHDHVGAMARGGVDDGALFACHDNAGVYAYDVSGANATAPQEIGHLEFTPTHEACEALLLDGNRLYIGGHDHLGVADVTDPAHPTMLTQVAALDGGSFLALAKVRIVGRPTAPGTGLGTLTIALLAVTSAPDPMGFHGRTTRLTSFSLADPAHPSLAWSSPDLRGGPGADGLAVARDVAFVAAKDAGVYVFDVSAPLAPVLEGRFDTPGSAIGARLARGRGVLYLAQGEGGVAAVNLGRLPADDP